MKTKLLLLLLLFALTSSTCSNDEQQTGCDCEIGYYLYVPEVGGLGGEYQHQFSEPIDFDCVNEDYGFYFQVSNVNYNYAKIECE